MATTTSVVSIDPEVMSGAPVFAGTRVPIQNLFDYLKAGERISEFYIDFPTVTKEQVHQLLSESEYVVTEKARNA